MESTTSSTTISAFGVTHIGGSNNVENQDTFFINTDTRVFGVFDGHGQEGKKISETACNIFIAESSSSVKTIEKVFTEVDEVLKHTIGSEPTSGGTTASILCVNENGTCKVCHVGDSEVRMYDSGPGAEAGTGPDGVSLVEDHSATSLPEFMRIRALQTPIQFEFGGKRDDHRPVFVKGTTGKYEFHPEGGFSYCNVRNEYQAYIVGPFNERLAMTRAIGDFNMKKICGVTAEPSVVTSDVIMSHGQQRVFVLASDGLWDGIHYSEVGAILLRPDLVGNAEAAAKELMSVSLAKNKRFFGPSTDNITIVVVYMTV
jgi:serine/threonine protein phosphatase PrpC